MQQVRGCTLRRSLPDRGRSGSVFCAFLFRPVVNGWDTPCHWHSHPTPAKIVIPILRPLGNPVLPSTPRPTRPKKVTGLRYWMLQVLEECEHVSVDFGADPVHDLRVALRRCRSLADGLMALDPDPDWKAMKKAGKRLFQRLGALRDVQVMMEWVEKLHPKIVERSPLRQAQGKSPFLPASGEIPQLITHESSLHSSPGDPVAEALFKILTAREREQKLEAHAALEEFDRKQGRQWS